MRSIYRFLLLLIASGLLSMSFDHANSDSRKSLRSLALTNENHSGNDFEQISNNWPFGQNQEARSQEFEIHGNTIRFLKPRLYLEPNYAQEAANERLDKGIKASLFSNPESARLLQNYSRPTSKIIWNDDSYQVRKSDEFKRFPMVEFNKDQKTAKCQYIDAKDSLKMAYTAMAFQELEYPIFIPVLLMSFEQLYELFHEIEILLTKKSGLEQRRAILELQTHLLGLIVTIPVNDTYENIKEAMPLIEYLSALPASCKLCGTQSYIIYDPQILTNADVYEIYRRSEVTSHKIKRILNNPEYQAQFKSGNAVNIWFPLADLP